MLWRPRSILHLVLLGFLIVVAPLCIAIFFTLQALDQQASLGDRMTRELVAVTRQSQRLQADLLDLERLARQYATLGEGKLLPLFRETLSRSLKELKPLAAVLDDAQQALVRSLAGELGAVAHGVPAIDSEDRQTFGVLAAFDRISATNQALQGAVGTSVDRSLNRQTRQVDELKASLRNLVVLLALLTLITALLFIHWINNPIRQIEREIKALGGGARDRAIRISGPLEMQALGQRLEWLQGQLNQLEEQKRQFLRHMSHELKTPLASLREGADLMAEGVVGRLDARQQEIVAIIQQNSWELQRLIENLLDFNQTLEHHSLELRDLALAPLCDELLEPYRMQIARRSLKVAVRGPAQEWCADGGKLKTALDNLISNAVNYCDSGGQILIEWACEDADLVIDVANDGQPVPPQEAERIFQPFFQGSVSRGGAIKGSGIGLSVARECIEAQGGVLRLWSKRGWNTCFRIQLPMREEAA